jgi:hypothetical protein
MSLRKGSIDRRETLDEFPASEGLLAETEQMALEQIVADQVRAATGSAASGADTNGSNTELSQRTRLSSPRQRGPSRRRREALNATVPLHRWWVLTVVGVYWVPACAGMTARGCHGAGISALAFGSA